MKQHKLRTNEYDVVQVYAESLEEERDLFRVYHLMSKLRLSYGSYISIKLISAVTDETDKKAQCLEFQVLT